MIKKIFVIYGDQRFSLSRERIRNEALRIRVFDQAIVETEAIQNDEVFSF